MVIHPVDLSLEVLVSSFGELGIALSFMLYLLQLTCLPGISWRQIGGRISGGWDTYKENRFVENVNVILC